MPELSLNEAIKILNRSEHRGCGRWYVLDAGADCVWVRGDDNFDVLHEFEAVAIAEKYLRIAVSAAILELTDPDSGG